MINVTSCNASHTNCKNVFGGFGGIILEPNVSRLCCMSAADPLRPMQMAKVMLVYFSLYTFLCHNSCLSYDFKVCFLSNYAFKSINIVSQLDTADQPTFIGRSIQLFTNLLHTTVAIEFVDTFATPKLHELAELLKRDTILGRPAVYRRHDIPIASVGQSQLLLRFCKATTARIILWRRCSTGLQVNGGPTAETQQRLSSVCQAYKISNKL